MSVQPRQRRQTLTHGVSHGSEADPTPQAPAGRQKPLIREPVFSVAPDGASAVGQGLTPLTGLGTVTHRIWLWPKATLGRVRPAAFGTRGLAVERLLQVARQAAVAHGEIAVPMIAHA